MANPRNKAVQALKITGKILGTFIFVAVLISLLDLIFTYIENAIILPHCVENPFYRKIIIGGTGNSLQYICEGGYGIYYSSIQYWIFRILVLGGVIWIVYKLLWNEIVKIPWKRVINKSLKYGFIFILILQGLFLPIDLYNFYQLHRVKPVLESMGDQKKIFYTLKEFNNRISTKITPIYDCYYVSNENGKEGYIFGFKLHSLPFILYNWSFDYAYPKYDLDYWHFCDGGCYDRARYEYEEIISNSCKKYEDGI